MRNSKVLVGGVLGLGLLTGSAYLVGRARGAGVPSSQTLTYSGVLTDAAGAPLTGPKNIQVTLWDQEKDGTPKCTVGPNPMPLTAGAFSVPLPAKCTEAVHASPDLWVEVIVNDAALPRTKLGATPYTLEAAHAVAADQGAAGFAVAGDAKVSGSLNVGGRLIRQIARVHGNGPYDDKDVGLIDGRTLAFAKTQAATAVRVTYEDNLRVAGNGNNDGKCRYEIKFNGVSCTKPGPLVYDLYFGGVTGMNVHRPATLVGTCEGLAAGSYNVQVYVGPIPGQSQGDCYTGWASQYWTIEAEEVF